MPLTPKKNAVTTIVKSSEQNAALIRSSHCGESGSPAK